MTTTTLRDCIAELEIDDLDDYTMDDDIEDLADEPAEIVLRHEWVIEGEIRQEALLIRLGGDGRLLAATWDDFGNNKPTVTWDFTQYALYVEYSEEGQNIPSSHVRAQVVGILQLVGATRQDLLRAKRHDLVGQIERLQTAENVLAWKLRNGLHREGEGPTLEKKHLRAVTNLDRLGARLSRLEAQSAMPTPAA